MKVLILIRHAKSSWKDPGLTDHERPLNKRGKRDAPEMGRRLALRRVSADVIISSTAERALATAEIIARRIGYDAERIVLDERIYDGSAETLVRVIRELNDAFDRAMLFGHNPGLTEAVRYLAACPIDNVPTCGIVEMTFDTERWADVGDARGQLVEFDYPKKTR